ncbi:MULTISPECIES: methyltransferase domain-containing protein [Stenotrophomonas]|nr:MULTISPECIES: methyltransferase domain-containing protein [Stenotrophomonas]MDH1232004.1 methyltransferase domain-containing protein [Stenotrophomonas sp. GD03930]HEL4297145.1 methyltransferase domain-containing protein [Stenotrophomonas maltophilia]
MTDTENQPLDPVRLMNAIRMEVAVPGRAVTEEDVPESMTIEEIIARISTAAPSPARKLSFDRRRHAVAKVAAEQRIRTLPRKESYSAAEIYSFYDVEFIHAAYMAALGRAPDPGGEKYYLGLLRAGTLSKVDILGVLRWSAEGRSHNVPIRGLWLPYQIGRVSRRRIVGPVVRWSHALLGISRIKFQLRMHDNARALESIQMQRELADISARLRTLDDASGQTSTLSSRTDSLENDHVSRDEYIRLEATHAGLKRAYDLLSGRVAEMERSQDLLNVRLVEAHRLHDLVLGRVSELERSQGLMSVRLAEAHQEHELVIGRLVEAELSLDLINGHVAEANALHELASGRLVELEQGQQLIKGQHADAEHSHGLLEKRTGEVEQLYDSVAARLGEMARALQVIGQQSEARASQELSTSPEQLSAGISDQVYAAFEDAFRGSRESLLRKVEPYNAWMKECGAGSSDGPILDIGCGRGEWLELVRENQWVGRGIDLNKSFVDHCRSLGLDVAQGDAIALLREIPDGSIGAVTSMHLVEHLPYEVAIALIDESLRVLRPGGSLILETPNPENLMVGAHWFYLDPTHRNPIPPASLAWLVKQRGFQEARIERLTYGREMDVPTPLEGDDATSNVVNFLLKQVSFPADYAIVGRKAAI